MIGDYLRSTLEWQNWGANFSTFVFIATVILTCFQAWGILKQKRTAQEKQSTESISIPFISYYACFFLSFLCYGLAIKSIAITFNGVLGFFYLALLYAFNKIKRFNLRQILLLATFSVMVVIMISLKKKDDFLFLIMLGSAIPLLHQPFEMWKNKSIGSFDFRFVLPFLVSTTFWSIYAFIIDDWVLKISCPLTLVIIFLIIGLWFRYRKPNPTS